jgi:phage shock protein PspC (stress-responsive transcriptional regulator)
MEPVVTVNLNGNPYQLDQSAHDALKAYLDAAEAALASNPDKAEIMRDLEQAIADKCRAFLSPHKSIISAEEMKKALDEMGPVEGADQASSSGADAPGGAQGQTGGARKRIYRITEGAQIAGVCAGLGAYFDLDVNWIRFLFIVAALLTSGGFVLVYVAMMFLIPSAQTSEQWAEAHGIPFNAQEVIDGAKRQYQNFAQNPPPWWGPRSWRQQRRAWKRQMKDQARAWAHGWRYSAQAAPAPPPSGPISYAGSVLGGFLMLILTFIRVIVAIVFFAILISLLTTGSAGYYHLPPHVELWQAILVLFLIYAVISIPLRALRWTAWGMMGRPYYAYRGAEGLVALVAVIAIVLLAYHHSPEAKLWLDRAQDFGNHVVEDLRHDFGN